MAIYDINYTRLISWLIPVKIRSEFMLNWLKALLAPVNILYNDFTRYRQDVAYRTAITPQVCYMEKMLNDAFDPELRRIYISDTQDYLVMLIHTDEAQKPLITHMEGSGHDEDIPVIHDNSAYADSGYDFNVNIPFQLTTSDEYRMKAILNTYKLASKRFKILYV